MFTGTDGEWPPQDQNHGGVGIDAGFGLFLIKCFSFSS